MTSLSVNRVSETPAARAAYSQHEKLVFLVEMCVYRII